MISFSVLTYNFVSIPFVSKNVKKRTTYLIEEIKKIRPDVICFQELWWKGIRNRIIRELETFGYNVYFPKLGRLFNGLLTCSRHEIKNVKALNFKPTFNGFNRLLIESLGAKGYSLVEIKLSEGKKVFIFNVHLNCHWQTDVQEKSLVYNKIKLNSLKSLAKDINELGQERIVAIGDFNIEPDWWFYKEFIRQASVKDVVPNNFITILPTLFRFPMPEGGRTDYVFTKNISEKKLKGVRLLWNMPIKGVGQLSDHAGVIATLDV